MSVSINLQWLALPFLIVAIVSIIRTIYYLLRTITAREIEKYLVAYQVGRCFGYSIIWSVLTALVYFCFRA